jgi:tetratricopeptide (TPR) repeat protein
LPPFEQAISFLQAVVQREPKIGIAHYLLAEAYETARRYEEEIEAFADAKHLDDDCDACGAVGQLAEKVFEGGQAVGVLRKLVAKYPEDFDFRYALVWAFRRGGRRADAEGLYRELIAYVYAPGSPYELSYELQANLELELSSLLRPSEASVALVEKALPRLGSEWNRKEVEDGLADDYLGLGRFEDALRLYLKCIKEACPSVGLTGDLGRHIRSLTLISTRRSKRASLRFLNFIRIHPRSMQTYSRVKDTH